MTHGLGGSFLPPTQFWEIWEIFLFVFFCSLVIINQQQQHLLLCCTYPSKCNARSEMMISARWKMGDDFEFLFFFLILKCCSCPVALTYLSFNHHYWSLWNTFLPCFRLKPDTLDSNSGMLKTTLGQENKLNITWKEKEEERGALMLLICNEELFSLIVQG